MQKLFQSTRSIFRATVRDEYICNVAKRYAFVGVPPVPKPEELPKYEVCKDEKLWKYVERLLPETYIPDPPKRKYYPSGWKPQKLNENMLYAVKRSKNHMLPIYLEIGGRGERKRTVIRHIFGDINKMALDILNFLDKINGGKKVGVKAVEACGKIVIMGDHYSNIKLWLERRNF